MNEFNVIKRIIGGHSGAELYKVEKNNKIYCMKVYERELDNKYCDKIKEICSTYDKLSIKSLKVFDYGTMNKKTFLLFNYINGQDFKKYSESNLDYNSIYEFGKNIGRKFKQLKKYNLPTDTLIEDESIDSLTQLINKKYEEIKSNIVKRNLIEKYFTIDIINKRIEEFNTYKNLFYKVKKGLIHGDIKRSNFMIDNNNIYIIDIGNMKNSYDVLNFRYQITWLLFENNKKEQEFIRGYFDGLYNYKRPKYFNEQLKYVFLMNFIEHTYKMNNLNEMEKYFEQIRKTFIKLDNNNNYII